MTSMCKPRAVRYQDLLDIPTIESGEKSVLLKQTNDSLVTGVYDRLRDMAEIFPSIPVRTTVRDKLVAAATKLKVCLPDSALKVTYGYRSLEIQTLYFNQRSLALFNRTDLTLEEKESIHQLIAVPDKAGHPTGGAVDLTIISTVTGQTLDMGTTLYDLENDQIKFFAPVTQLQRRNRELLREIMMGQGFAPFDGEWWHFSYGDAEWAYYYQQKNALYSQIPLAELQRQIAS